MSGQDGTVRQRHLRTCPRTADGAFKNHKCKGPWGYVVDRSEDAVGPRRLAAKSGFATKAEARAALREYLQTREAGIEVTVVLRVGEYLDQWLAAKRALRPSTLKSYRGHIDQYLKPYLGNRKLTELKASDIDAMLTAISKPRARRPIGTATIRRVYATLRVALNNAVKRRLIPYNPAVHVELAAERRDPTTVWTPFDVSRFLAAISEHRAHPLLHLALVTGMRRGELAGLRWQDVHLDEGFLRVEQQVIELSGKRHVGPPKTHHGRRVVALDPTTIGILRRHLDNEERLRSRSGLTWSMSDFVFTDAAGQGLRPDTITRSFKTLAAKAGVPVIRFHDLRHTSASLALGAGVPMKVVSERLGHSTTGITADLYTHVSPALARDAANAIGQLVAPTSGDKK